MRYKEINLIQQTQLAYLGCVLDESMSCEPMTLKVMNKIHRECFAMHLFSNILTTCTQLCTQIFPKQKQKRKYQIIQNKCIWLSLRLDKMHYIHLTEFRSIN